MLRRELFRQGAGALALLGMAAFPANTWAETDTPNNPYFIEADVDNPLLRAATIDLRTRNEQGLYFRGKGGLARREGILGILTVNHVIRDQRELQFQIPGHPLALVDTATLRACQEQSGEVDKAIFMPLPGEFTNLLESLSRAEILTPLTIDHSPVKIGEMVAQPNITIGYDLFEVKGQYNPRSEIMLESPSSVPICKGISGTPILRVKNNQVLQQVIGVVKSFPTNTRLNTDSNSREYNCSLYPTIADASML